MSAVMPYLPAALTVASALTNIMGKQAGQDAAVKSAKNRQAGLNFEANQLDVNAGQQQAASQRTAADQTRIGDLTQSRLMALVASQGGASTDPSVMSIRARVDAEKAYRANSALYQGDEAARQMTMAAEAKRLQGNNAVVAAEAGQRSSNLSQFGTLLNAGILMGTSSMRQKYNPNGGPGAAAEDRWNSDFGILDD